MLLHFENSKIRASGYDNETDFDFESSLMLNNFDLPSDYKIPSYIKNQKIEKNKAKIRFNEQYSDKSD